MAYIARKVCMFAGHNFLKGEVIPDELVLKSRVPQLVKTKVIEVVDGVSAPVKEEEIEEIETVEEAEEIEEIETDEEIEESEIEPETVAEPAKRGRKKKSE